MKRFVATITLLVLVMAVAAYAAEQPEPLTVTRIWWISELRRAPRCEATPTGVYGYGCVAGTCRNNTDQDYERVKVTIGIYSVATGDRLGSATAYTDLLPAGKQWSFVTEPGVTFMPNAYRDVLGATYRGEIEKVVGTPAKK